MHSTLRKCVVVFVILSLFGASAIAAEKGKIVSAEAKKQSEELMNAVLPFAEQMLRKHGEFFPFGGTINKAGKIENQGAWTGSEHPPSQEVIETLHKAYVLGAKKGDYIATALVYDVRVIPPGQKEKTDAIAVDISHRDGISQTVIYPYRLKDKQFVAGEPYAVGNQHPVF
jgi:hypothetical protein